MKENISIILIVSVIAILTLIIRKYDHEVEKNYSTFKKLEFQIKEYQTEEETIRRDINSFYSSTSTTLAQLKSSNLKLLHNKSGECISVFDYGVSRPEKDTRYSGSVNILSKPSTIFSKGHITIRQNNRIVSEFDSEYIYSIAVYDNDGYEYKDNLRK